MVEELAHIRSHAYAAQRWWDPVFQATGVLLDPIQWHEVLLCAVTAECPEPMRRVIQQHGMQPDMARRVMCESMQSAMDTHRLALSLLARVSTP